MPDSANVTNMLDLKVARKKQASSRSLVNSSNTNPNQVKLPLQLQSQPHSPFPSPSPAQSRVMQNSNKRAANAEIESKSCFVLVECIFHAATKIHCSKWGKTSASGKCKNWGVLPGGVLPND